jgi:hypothetical protein
MNSNGPRGARLGVRLREAEIAAVRQLAHREFLTPTGLIRRLVLRACAQAGITVREGEQVAHEK